MSESMTVEQERDKWQEIANRWLAVSNDQALAIDALKQERDELRRQNDDLILKQFDHIGSGNKAVRRIKAAAVREACDKVLGDYRAVSFDKNENLYLNVVALRDYANQIEGGA